MFPLILSGGSNILFWPISHSSYPKQFLPIARKWTNTVKSIFREEVMTQSIVTTATI